MSPAVSAADVAPPLAAFAGSFAKTKVSWVYQIGLAVVALAMLMLPLIYVGLIVLAGWAVWWHILNDTFMFESAHGRGAFVMLVLYAAPVVIGGIFVLFLIKPLFSRPAKPPKPFAITEAMEPELFAFIRKICDLVGAAHPREVLVDCQVNASASFRRGWWSLLGNDLRLTIGMPLLAGLSMRQLAGVLAHEFGHFAQGAGMRFSYLIRSVNNWFARVVFERDAWDERLDEWARDSDWRLMIVLKCAQGGVWVGRKVLWCLMMAGHFISCFMARQMEFDADSYEAKLAGSEEFPKTARRLRMLGAAANAAMGDAQSQYRHRQLPADLAAMIVWREQTMPEDFRKRLDTQVAEEKTHWHHTHPADADRNRAVLALQAPGVFHVERPASELLSDFPNLSRAATRHYYQKELELNLDKVVLNETDKAVADRRSADKADSQLDKFFGPHFHFLRVQALAAVPVTAWPAARDAMAASAASYGKLLERYTHHRKRLTNVALAKDLLGAQYRISKPEEFDLAESSIECAIRTHATAENEARSLGEAMSIYETAAWTRLGAGVRWRMDESAALEDGERQRLGLLVHAQRNLAGTVPQLWRLNDSCSALELLYANARNHQNAVVLQSQVDVVVKRLRDDFREVGEALAQTGHPYLDGHPPIPGVLNTEGDDSVPAARAHRQAKAAVETLIPLLVRVCGDLAGLALAAEPRMLGLPQPVLDLPQHEEAGHGG
ncbi:MAG TPA: M48 family metalloprotease [Prosthecobacter sp.]|nr:M48 family metalloprotease [Prosthecobacter sp.]